MVYCRKCGTKLVKFCHGYLCEDCCIITTNKKIEELRNLHSDLTWKNEMSS